VRLMDVSISKSHCTFTLHENQVYMYDLGSKYGSLIKCEKPVRISSSAPTTVQIGNHLITANYESFLNKGCCNLYILISKNSDEEMGSLNTTKELEHALLYLFVI